VHTVIRTGAANEGVNMTITEEMPAETPVFRGVLDAIRPGLRDDVVARLVDQQGWEIGFAEGALDECLAFLDHCSRRPQGAPATPSSSVDEVWHELLKDPAVFAQVCAGLGTGHLLGHKPDAPVAAGDQHRAAAAVRDRRRATVLAMRAAGYQPDDRYWPSGGLVLVTAGCTEEGGSSCEESPAFPPSGAPAAMAAAKWATAARRRQ
jgi:hypothetical protein